VTCSDCCCDSLTALVVVYSGVVTAGVALDMFEVFGRTRPPILEGRHFGPESGLAFISPLLAMLIKEPEMLHLQYVRFVSIQCGRGSVPADPLGSLRLSPDLS